MTSEAKRGHRRWLLVLGSTVAMAGLVAVWLTSVAERPGGSGANGSGSVSIEGVSWVTIRGDVREPIRPGIFAPVDLVLHNMGSESVELRAITVRLAEVEVVRETPRRPCTISDYAVRQLDDEMSLSVAAGDRVSLGDLGLPKQDWPAVGMLDLAVNQDGCRGAVVTMTYEASGTERQ